MVEVEEGKNDMKIYKPKLICTAITEKQLVLSAVVREQVNLGGFIIWVEIISEQEKQEA